MEIVILAKFLSIVGRLCVQTMNHIIMKCITNVTSSHNHIHTLCMNVCTTSIVKFISIILSHSKL